MPFFFTNFNLSHQRSVTTFSCQTKQMYWNSVDTILLVQLWRIIKLVTYTVAAWKKFMYSCLAHKTFLYILWQNFPLLHNGLRLLFNSCVILIQCWVFNFIFHFFTMQTLDYLDYLAQSTQVGIIKVQWYYVIQGQVIMQLLLFFAGHCSTH